MGRKINLSGISPAKCNQSEPNLVYVDMSRGDNVHEISGVICKFWAKWGLARVPRSASFFCGKPDDLSATSQRPISTKFGETYFGVPSRNPERHFRKFQLSRSSAPKILNRKSVKQAPHSEQATGHGMHCREILFTPCCSSRASDFPRSGQLFV